MHRLPSPISILALVLVIAGCTTAPAVSPSASAEAGPTATALPSDTPVASASPSEAPSGALEIAFVRVDGPIFGEVFLTEDGESARQLTELQRAEVNSGGAQAVAWSPGGERLAFAFGPSITAGWGILDPEGGEPLIIDGIGSFAWSPDGSRAAAGAAFDVLPTEVMNALAVSLVDPETGETEQIGQGILAGWHPDGERVVVMRVIGISDTSSGTPQLILISTVDGSEEELIPGALSASWSPDGSRVAYVVPQRCVGVACARILVADEGSDETADLVAGNHPVWSPDGRRLAYMFDTAEGPRVGVVDLESGESVDLGSSFHPPTWSPDGRLLAVSTQLAAGESVVRVIDVDRGELVAEFPGFAPDWRPDASAR